MDKQSLQQHCKEWTMEWVFHFSKIIFGKGYFHPLRNKQMEMAGKNDHYAMKSFTLQVRIERTYFSFLKEDLQQNQLFGL